jgi:hypothetical protein
MLPLLLNVHMRCSVAVAVVAVVVVVTMARRLQ